MAPLRKYPCDILLPHHVYKKREITCQLTQLPRGQFFERPPFLTFRAIYILATSLTWYFATSGIFSQQHQN